MSAYRLKEFSHFVFVVKGNIRSFLFHRFDKIERVVGNKFIAVCLSQCRSQYAVIMCKRKILQSLCTAIRVKPFDFFVGYIDQPQFPFIEILFENFNVMVLVCIVNGGRERIFYAFNVLVAVVGEYRL